MLTVKCICGEQYHAAPEHIGRSIRCRRCGQIVHLLRSLAQRPRERLTTSPPWTRYFTGASPTRRRYQAYAILGSLLLLFGSIYALKWLPSRRVHGPSVMASAAQPPSTPMPVSVPEAVAVLDATPLPTGNPEPSCTADANRPGSGQEFIAGQRGGHGVLIVDNGGGSDAVVALYDLGAGRTARRFFVRAGEKGQARSIRPGLYSIRFAFGDGYSTRQQIFCAMRGASEFDRTVHFDETRDDDGVRYSELEITLHPVRNGNVPHHAIDPTLVFGEPLIR